MSIKIGDKLPDATFMHMGAQGPEPITSEDFFADKRVVVFALPGAFTPTCSAKHLPGFMENADALAAKGIDKIACLSVNDVFVMDAWSRDQNVGDTIDMLADGNCDFTAAIGLELDGTGFGMGRRSQRYAMIVNDGVVEALHVEDGGEFRVSAADYMLENM
ncbi:MAG: peroxiredoxin [Robiginitomaculum sp.]|nr:peroxiredoxin [Robiginitomaculum sp.]